MKHFALIFAVLYAQSRSAVLENYDKGTLQILGNGMVPIEEGDVAINFYLTLYNNGSVPCEVYLHMLDCCESLHGSIDCKSTYLFSGFHGNLAPHQDMNVSLIIANMYVTSRVGACVLDVQCRNQFSITYLFNYNTSPGNHTITSPGVTSCQTQDQDVLNACRPTNCHLKYNGQRSFYNGSTCLCDVTPVCVSDDDYEIEEVYNSDINKCKNLSRHSLHHSFEGPAKIARKVYLI